MHVGVCFSYIYLFIIGRQIRYTQKKWEKDLDVLVHSPNGQCGADLTRSQQLVPGNLWCAGCQGFQAVLYCFHRPQRAGWKVGQMGQKSALTWDPGLAKWGFIHWAFVLGPCSYWLVPWCFFLCFLRFNYSLSVTFQKRQNWSNLRVQKSCFSLLTNSVFVVLQDLLYGKDVWLQTCVLVSSVKFMWNWKPSLSFVRDHACCPWVDAMMKEA